MTLAGWTSVPLFLRYFAEHIDAWTSNGWRYAVAALFWAPILLLARPEEGGRRGLWRAALVPTVFNCVGQVAFTLAHYQIDPGLLTFGLRVQIVFAAVGAALLFPSEQQVVRSPRFVLGVGLVLVGTGLTIAFDSGFGARSNVLGVVLAMVAGLCFAGYALSVRRYMAGYRSIVAFAAISQLTAGVMVALMLAFGNSGGLEALRVLDAEQFALLVLSAMVGIALGHVFYYISIARLGVAVSTGVIQLQPFGVALASLALFHERLSAVQWVGGAAAVGGAAVILHVEWQMRRWRRRRPAAGIAEPKLAGVAGAEAERSGA